MADIGALRPRGERLSESICLARMMMNVSFTISVGCTPMPKKRSQPLLPVPSSTPNGISSIKNRALKTHSHCQRSARISMSSSVMTTNAPIPRNSAKVCTTTYFAGLA